MSKTTYSVQQAKNAQGSTDWKKVESLTDQDIRKAAMSDLDAKPLKEHEITQMKPIKFLKHKLGL